LFLFLTVQKRMLAACYLYVQGAQEVPRS